ncbi:putative flavonol 7-O-beta-glucosyltransferase [Rosa chinensis]|uniref:Glycosyltransferase n=1 Tax=Rosa chinensis TaxID=74649 RepID=A0A2P6QUZ4_ROSCH|nr:UDP-glycosyltransferase 73C4 [Rosa chinensis]XP_040374533.1 UDP-glycosyltransferase 73C4 [Rosa chinensis]PRQ37993.1 putative flavonol 7-O-beta-glucosyltransferase [Rosa chinensis]
MASESHDQLHFVLIPLMSPGHLLPMGDMAKVLAQHGLVVTIITTPLNAIRIKPMIDRAIDSGLSLHLVQFRLPLAECGLPEGCENMDAVPARNLFWNFFEAGSRLQHPIEELLETVEPHPSCIISDRHLPWTAEIARKFGIPRYLFDGTSCFTLLSNYNIETSKVLESVSGSEPFLVPGLPDEIEITLVQLPGHMNPASDDFREFYKKMKESEEGACGVVVNSFEDLEPEYVKEYRKVSRVWSIGPVSLSNDTELDKAQRGIKASVDENQCLKWLNSWPESSVVYVCLGSLSRVATLQLVELGLGLEASNQPFIWVVSRNKTEEWESWLLGDGFEDRIRARGLLIYGWAPQILILSHPAVGGFLTHCGWNSTLEGICAGIPMITWPMFAEQFYNEKLIVQVLKIGEKVGASVAVPLGKQERSVVTVRSGELKDAIEKVMVNEQGEERRQRAKRLAMMAKKATEEGGSSYFNIRLLIEDVISYKHP